MQKTLQSFAENASRLTGISIVVMLFSAISMMISIEDRLNRIWRVHQARGWGSRLLLYWAALTLGPILVVAGIAMSSYVTAMPLLAGAYQHFGMGQRLLARAAVRGHLRHPVADVRDRAQLPGVAARMPRSARCWARCCSRWRAGASRCSCAMRRPTSRSTARWRPFPIFLLWIYLSWVIVILGASMAASLSAYEYHPPSQTLPEGAEFLGLLVVLRHFVEAHRNGDNLDPATVRLQEPYLKSSAVVVLLRRPAAGRPDPARRGGRLAAQSRSLDSTDLLRVYLHTGYRLPLRPLEEAEALGIDFRGPCWPC